MPPDPHIRWDRPSALPAAFASTTGVNGAENASLTIMCGASSPATFERAKPFLGMMGQKVIMCGGLGMGLAAKLCNK